MEGGSLLAGPTLVCLLCGAELEVADFLTDDGEDVDIFSCPSCDAGTTVEAPSPGGAHVAA